jgi:DNA-binding NtrC family response regulator
MSGSMEVSGAMHLVKEIPVEDDKKLRGMARLFLRSGLDMVDMVEFAHGAYRIGRETEAQRHQCFLVGTMETYELLAVRRAMETCGNNPIKAARMLGIGRSTMYRKLQQFGIPYGNKIKPDEVTVDERAG